MTKQSIIIVLIILSIFLVAAWILWRDKEKRKKWFLTKVRKMWGSVADREYTEPELVSISHYARKHQGSRFMIDDITWNDLDMDKIFMVMNTTVSSCGEDVLYHMLRVPEFDPDTLQKRDELIEYFRSHQKEREEIQQVVREVRKFSSMSLSDYIYVLKDVERKGDIKYKLMALVNVIAIGLLLINPLAGGILLFIGIFTNGLVHMKDSKKIEPYLNCMICILRLLRAADGFEKIKNPTIQSYLNRIKKGRKTMQNFRRGAWLVASTNSVQDGLEAFVISYLKILFMVDMIKFYSMLKYVDGREAEIEDMFAAMGELDALIAIASFREFLPYYCVPELSGSPSEPCSQEHISFHAEDMYHPLIPDPVANSIHIHQGVLVTGSNASGKSTFLKTLALNAILAQTIHTCTCHAYQSVYLKVMTS
ncbi:MAG: DNA mismatch repair protein MutS, partial [Oliverpabstia sp.]